MSAKLWRAPQALALYLALTVLFPPSEVHAERTLYVNVNAAGANNGTSWANAYTDLHDALNDARVNGGCPCEVWIAEGIYKPDRGTGDRTLGYELFGDIALYGGFGGWEEWREDRDPALHETILDGDLLDDDDPTITPTSNCCVVTDPNQVGCDDQRCFEAVSEVLPFCARHWDPGSCAFAAKIYCCELCRASYCDNTFNVLRALEPGSHPKLDGLTVSGGHGLAPFDFPYGDGGGLYSDGPNPAVNNCVFRDNSGSRGAGIAARSGNPTITYSAFIENDIGFAVWGLFSEPSVANSLFLRNRNGGLNIAGSRPIADCVFIENKGNDALRVSDEPSIAGCTFLGNARGALFCVGNPLIIDCNFLGNTDGAGSAIDSFGGPIVINSRFSGNRAIGPSGFAGAVLTGSAILINSIFSDNSANGIGGLWAYSGATLRNCVFWNNRDASGTTESAQLSSFEPFDIDYSIVQGWTGELTPGGGVGNSGADPMFAHPLGPDGIIGTEDDDLRLSPGSPAINAGDPNTNYLPATDLDGHARVLCGRVDIGAYEFGIGDYDCDQIVDLFDFSAWSSCMTGPSTADTVVPQGCEAFDFDGDDDIDLLDFAELQAVWRVP